MSTNEKEKAKHGRRAAGDDDDGPKSVVKGWGDDGGLTQDATMTGSTMQADSTDPVDLPTLDAGVDEAAVRNSNREEEMEAMSKEVASAPTEYHANMPKLADLEQSANNKWGHLQHLAGDLDISCLTSVLCNQLDDDDVPWNPDQMLVQLTSELLEQNKSKDEADQEVSNAL